MAGIQNTLLIWILVWLHSSDVFCESTEVQGKDRDDYYCDGICNVRKRNCSCFRSCLDDLSCCTDYLHTCHVTPWIKDKCTPKKYESVCPSSRNFGKVKPVIIFSIDGFRDDYLSQDRSPNFWKLASCGVHAPYVRSVYPTSTFTNHQSIATGLYSESHGIIGQMFYDLKLGKDFVAKNPTIASDPRWWGGEPIWVTVSNNGLKSATYDWPGSHVNQTRFADKRNKEYSNATQYEKRVSQVLNWLDLGREQRPDFYALYVEWVDLDGHTFGPDSSNVMSEIKRADDAIGMLMNGLKLRQMENCVNIIVLADHGMAKCDGITRIDKYGVNTKDLSFYGKSAGRIGMSKDKKKWPLYKPEEIKNKLKCKKDKTHFQVFLKQKYLPKRLHYANNKRIEDVLLLMEDGWRADKGKGSESCQKKGAHGWDNEFKDMNAVFAAYGPAFKRGYNTSEPFENIEIYNLICDLMGVEPAPNNGTRGSLNHLLINPNPITFSETYSTPSFCPYPNESDFPTERLGCDECEGENVTNQYLNIPLNKAKKYQQLNVMAGWPKITNTAKTGYFCVLTHREYVTVYDLQRKMPYYASYFLDSKRQSTAQRPDIRMKGQDSPSCENYTSAENTTVTGIYLYHLSLSTGSGSDASILSNMVPVYKAFLPVWEQFNNILNNWAKLYGGISVVTGPIFDYDFDGRADSNEIIQRNARDECSLPLPTHIFAVLTKCNKPSFDIDSDIRDCWNLPDKVDVLSFIIPNYNETPCTYGQSVEDWVPQTLVEHVARIRDVELLSGISFFPDWTSNAAAHESIKINGLRRKVHLPEFTSNWVKDFDGNSTLKVKVFKLVMVLAMLLQTCFTITNLG